MLLQAIKQQIIKTMEQIYKKDNQKESWIFLLDNRPLGIITGHQKELSLSICEMDITDYSQDAIDDILLKIKEIYDFYARLTS